ncbi:MAG: LysE family translocator [Pseudomonadota bacterium]
MLAFAVAVFLLLITPGPGVLSTAGVGAAFGRRVGLRYLAGLFVGTNLVALAVISGLAAAVFALPGLRVVLTLASIAYLAWLAARIALAGSRIAFMDARTPPRLRDGLALQFVNPKAYVVNTTLFGGFPFVDTGPVVEILVKLLIVNAIWVPVHLVWLVFGIQVRRLDLPPRWQRTINVAMAAAMIGVVVLAASS